MTAVAVRYVTGDATAPQGDGPRIIVHVCNDIGGWGAGFVLAISRRWEEPEFAYRAWYESGQGFALGEVQLVKVEQNLFVANLIGQRGVGRTQGRPPIRYEAVMAGLGKVREHAQELGASVHMPRIGCGLAGGKWEEIEPLIVSQLSSHGIEVTVYDFAPSPSAR